MKTTNTLLVVIIGLIIAFAMMNQIERMDGESKIPTSDDAATVELNSVLKTNLDLQVQVDNLTRATVNNLTERDEWKKKYEDEVKMNNLVLETMASNTVILKRANEILKRDAERRNEPTERDAEPPTTKLGIPEPWPGDKATGRPFVQIQPSCPFTNWVHDTNKVAADGVDSNAVPQGVQEIMKMLQSLPEPPPLNEPNPTMHVWIDSAGKTHIDYLWRIPL